MHVRITDSARNVLNNRSLANKVIDAIMDKKKSLVRGEKVHVDDTDVSITLVTSIPDTPPNSKNRHCH